MGKTRVNAIIAIIDELDGFEINLNHYYEDAEPQGVYDRVLSGKLESLCAFCQTLGWSELVGRLLPMTPLGGNAVEALELVQKFVIPEVRRLIDLSDVEASPDPNQWFWDLIHPRVCALARPRYEAGFFADAVEACFKELNDVVKRLVVDQGGRELDGASLMTTAFSLTNPALRLNSLTTETDRNIQQGYMQIMAGSMTGIRNPKAHGNLHPDSKRTLHLIALASLLMCKVDERL